jgi:hypothetical protein
LTNLADACHSGLSTFYSAQEQSAALNSPHLESAKRESDEVLRQLSLRQFMDAVSRMHGTSPGAPFLDPHTLRAMKASLAKIEALGYDPSTLSLGDAMSLGLQTKPSVGGGGQAGQAGQAGQGRGAGVGSTDVGGAGGRAAKYAATMVNGLGNDGNAAASESSLSPRLSATAMDSIVEQLTRDGFAVIDGAFGLNYARDARRGARVVQKAGKLKQAARKWIRSDRYGWDYEWEGIADPEGDLDVLLLHQETMRAVRESLDARLREVGAGGGGGSGGTASYRFNSRTDSGDSGSGSDFVRSDSGGSDYDGAGRPMHRLHHRLPRLLEQSSTMLSLYAGTAAYRAHVDASEEDVAGFAITAIYYLNEGWRSEYGGQLRVTKQPTQGGGSEQNKGGVGQGGAGGSSGASVADNGGGTEAEAGARTESRTARTVTDEPLGDIGSRFIDIEPLGDRLVIFKSTSTMHQVLPLRRAAPDRFALSVWFRTAMKGSSNNEISRPITNICRFLPPEAP